MFVLTLRTISNVKIRISARIAVAAAFANAITADCPSSMMKFGEW